MPAALAWTLAPRSSVQDVRFDGAQNLLLAQACEPVSSGGAIRAGGEASLHTECAKHEATCLIGVAT